VLYDSDDGTSQPEIETSKNRSKLLVDFRTSLNFGIRTALQ